MRRATGRVNAIPDRQQRIEAIAKEYVARPEGRVLINMDTTTHPELINTRFAYVSVSRAASDAGIYTNDATTLAERLNTDISKTSAVQLNGLSGEAHKREDPSIQHKKNAMTNTGE